MKTNNLYAQLSVGQGPIGPVGPQGPKGDKGDKGETGAVGPQGPKGDKGERGARGPQGNQGAQGKQGPQGPVGLRGEKGEKGDRGPQGIQGIQGPKGDKGDTGAQGPKGERGEKGEKGDSGGVMPADMVDYMGNQHESLKAKNDADVDWLLGEVNTVHYDGQHITATDTIEGRSKSAILTGQTLVNIFDNWVNNVGTLTPVKTQDGYFLFTGSNEYARVNLDDIPTFKRGSEYTFIYRIKNLTYDGENNNTLRLEVGATTIYAHTVKNGIWKIKKSFSTDETNCFVKILSWMGSTGSAEVSLQIIEGDYTNVDIPYFGGMQSVKLPVLTTTGKNLFDKTKIIDNKYQNCNVSAGNFKISTNQNYMITDYIKVSPNTTYTKTNFDMYGAYYDENKQPIKTTSITSSTFTTPSNAHYIVLNFQKGVDDHENAQLELNTLSTPYEPFKSNILTVNEEVELHGIGDVKDTLDCLTGEVVERIGEIVLDGSESWVALQSGRYYIKNILNNVNRPHLDNINFKCDKLKPISYNEEYSDTLGISLYAGTEYDFIVRTDIQAIEEFKQWLSNNPTTVQYQLKTESVKTVDLSDNHVYSYKGTTHYDCSSAEGSLVPTLSIDVPTKLNALVARQKDTIQELTQENESLKAAQQILLNSQLSFYESLVSTIPALMPVEGGQAIIPDFIQDLYRLENNQK